MTGPADNRAGRHRRRLGGLLALFGWCYLVWLPLSGTFTVEQLLFGAGVSLIVAAALAPLGPPVPGPWWLLRPRRLLAVSWLVAVVLSKVVLANVALAARVWRSSRRLNSGMVVVPTTQRSPGGLAAVGVLTSLIVDNQIVDVDRSRHELQYHCLTVPERAGWGARAEINGPVETLLSPLAGRGRTP
ncbi:MAG: Na+/H+ antiporter subunit E [Actinomycetota bacterium]|nr:Na+/H+ antiporter subunit E [Actinomycetota bacterium]